MFVKGHLIFQSMDWIQDRIQDSSVSENVQNFQKCPSETRKKVFLDLAWDIKHDFDQNIFTLALPKEEMIFGTAC